MRRAGQLLLSLLGALLWIAPSPLAAQPQPPPILSFGETLARRRAAPAEGEALALLAEARRAAAGAGSIVAESPSGAVSGGPRRGDDGGHESDLALGLDLPLLAGRGARAELARELPTAAVEILAGARALAAAELALAFVDAWLAQVSVEIRVQDLAATDEWLAAARRRVEAGADPPYEPTLVAGERDRALVELVAARRASELAWGELAARSDVGPEPRALGLEDLPSRSVAAGGTGVAAAGIAARRRLSLALVRARAGAARSRWALQSEVAAEGDERLAHLGVAYRLPLPGERGALAAEQTAAEASAERAAQVELAALDARLAAAAAALDGELPALDSRQLEHAGRALMARLAEGKERASQILPLRRQLLEARLAGLAAHAARARAQAELHFLLGGIADAP